MRPPRAAVPLLATLLALGGACGADDGETKNKANDAGSAAQALVGLFRLEGGQCTGGPMSGSFFRMINPAGKAGVGPFISNGDSPCDDKTYSPMFPGSDGGLRSGAYQAEVSPPFDGGGHGATELIAKGTPFFAVRFAVATNQKDPQSNNDAPVPSISAEGGKLTGGLAAFAASWNHQHFNQGAPKPDGSTPGLTSGPTGTFDPATRKYSLDWSSQIVGGPFNNFTGVWHFEGTFEPKA